MLRMLLAGGMADGRRVLSEQAVRQMEADQTRGAAIAFSPQARFGAGDRRYGIGVWRDAVDEAGTARQVSSPGAFGFTPWIDRERGIAGVFVVRDAGPRVRGIVDELQRRVRDAVDAARTGS